MEQAPGLGVMGEDRSQELESLHQRLPGWIISYIYLL